MSGKIINVSDNLNYDRNGSAWYPAMQVYRNELYCAWGERSVIKIKKYDGSVWINVSDNLNYGNETGNYPAMQVYKDELYCIWAECINSTFRIRIKKYNGNTWSSISSNLNYGSKGAGDPSMQVYKDELYCAWRESNGSNNQIRIKKYDGNAWVNVSSNLNYNGNMYASYPTMQVYEDELYCAWDEKNSSNRQIKIKKYNGNTWTNVSSNLNYNGTMEGLLPMLQVYKNELYCAWMEMNANNSNTQIKVKKYNGDNWINISSNLNYYGSYRSEYPIMQIYKEELYCVWSESKEPTRRSSQMRMKKYDGSNWAEVPDILNYDKNAEAILAKLQVYKNELYCVWMEKNGAHYNVKMKKYALLIEKVQKYLIKHNNKYFKINDYKEIVQVENNNFKTNGFDNINIITRELLQSKFHDLKNIQLLMWTDDIEKNEAIMTCELRNPYRPIDILKKNNNGICNILFKEL